MNNLAKLAAALVGLFSIALGLMAYFMPDKIAPIMGLTADNALGWHSMRGDIGAVFLTSALGCALALFKGKAKALYIPVAVYGFVLIGRLIGLASTGVQDGVMQPILIEIVLIGLSLFAARTLSKTA